MRRALAITLLGMMLCGSALADGSLTCSTKPLAFQVGCFVELPAFTLWNVEVAYGADLSIDTRDDGLVSLAPYLIAAWYGDTTSFWVEVALPEFHGIPVLGSPDPVRAGFSITF